VSSFFNVAKWTAVRVFSPVAVIIGGLAFAASRVHVAPAAQRDEAK